ncbi:M48 family metalloprotease [Flavobacteriaceae bacterium]|nr:M48 family metalloprotease [Flavobacteriaceae bacterium]
MKQFKIGKGTANDLVIENDPTVSRVHLAVFIDDEKNIFVTDLKSTNGTYVNGVKIEESVKLKTLDVLKIGNTLVNWPKFLKDDDNIEKVYQTLNDSSEIAKSDKIIKNSTKKVGNIYKYALVLIFIILGIILSMAFAEKEVIYNFDDIKNSNEDATTLDYQNQQKKQRTNVTYDFSCLNSDGDAGTNDAIYSFGEITRDIQSSFFEDVKISVHDEQEQGRKLLKALKKEYRFIETGDQYQKLKSILNNLVSRLATPKGFNYKIFLLDDPTVNAVTLGGHIFFYKGMYDFCKTNSEIAAIISHEIAHNELGHSTLAIKKQKAANDWGIFGEIFLEIENATTLSFNQKQESEADLFGMDLVYPTSFKNCDAIKLWNRMSQNESRFDVIENFFRSHPYSKNRSRCIKNHLKSNYNKYCY